MSTLINNMLDKVRLRVPEAKEPLTINFSWLPDRMLKTAGQVMNNIAVRIDSTIKTTDPSPGHQHVHALHDQLLREDENERLNNISGSQDH